MTEPIAILVIAGRHTFAGVIDHQDHRVLDVLNDPSTDFLRLQQVRVGRDSLSACVAQCGAALVPKATIDVVTLMTTQHEAPLRRPFAFVEKRPCSVLVVLSDYEIRGELMVQGRVDPVRVMGRDTPTFFPVTQATVVSVQNPNHSLPGVVALVNKSRVTMFHVDDGTLMPSSSVSKERQRINP